MNVYVQLFIEHLTVFNRPLLIFLLGDPEVLKIRAQICGNFWVTQYVEAPRGNDGMDHQKCKVHLQHY